MNQQQQQIETTTTTTISFLSVFRLQYIRNYIFKEIECISNIDNIYKKNAIFSKSRLVPIRYRKGRDIIQSVSVYEMIGRYALPWSFIKHYLPARINPRFMETAYQHYILHPNSTVETFKQIINWTPSVPFDRATMKGDYRINVKDIEFVRYLVEHLFTPDHFKERAIILVKHSLREQQIKVAEYLLMEYIKYNVDPKENKDMGEEEEEVKDIFTIGAEMGSMEIVKLLRQRMEEPTIQLAMAYTIMGDHYDILEYLEKETGVVCDNSYYGDIMKRAIDDGNLEKFRHYYQLNDCKYGGIKVSRGRTLLGAIDYAANEGHLHIVEYLHHNTTEGCTTEAMDRAAGNGHLNVVEFLHRNRSEGCTTRAIDEATCEGHLNVVKFLDQNRSEGCSIFVMDATASYGHLDVIEYLHHNRSETCTTDAMDTAARCGYLEIVEFLHRNQSGCTTNAMDSAAEYGCLDIVKFLHHNRTEGCTTDAMDNAAKNGHLSVVEFLHYNRSEGCTREAMNYAINYGHIEIIEFLHKNRSEGYSSGCIPKSLPVMKWLYSNDQEFKENVHKTDILQLHQYRYCDDIDMVKFVIEKITGGEGIENRTHLSHPRSLISHVKMNEITMFAYLWENALVDY